jgi:NitT/TauT family transport system substrate-binding protein
MNRISRAILFGALALLGGAAFSAELTKVTVGASPAMSSLGLFIAREKGYFAEQGIDAEITPFKASTGQMIPLLAAGKLMVGGGNVAAGLYNAIANDIPVKIVADKGLVSPKHGYLALMVRKELVDSGRYKDFSSLKGMTMAVTAKGVTQEIVTEMYLKKAGLTLNDIKLTTLGYADMNVAMANGSLDATVQIEPYVAVAVEKGIAARVSGNDDIYPNQQSAVIMYSPVFIEKHPDLARAFMVAYVKALRDYNKAFGGGGDKKEILNILAKYTGGDDPGIFERVVPVGLHPDGRMNAKGLADDARWFVEHGYVKQMPNMDAIVDESYVDFAVQTLGAFK